MTRPVTGAAASAIVILALALSTSAAFAQAPARTAVDRGRTTFQETCAVCHGDRGRGDGLAASSLTPRPINLTALAKKDGLFPAAHVEAVLKGTDTVGAHSSEMMIWRALFLADANGNEKAADARVTDLIRYLESIQVTRVKGR
jgi:mono/diheme cytochrome c family protein